MSDILGELQQEFGYFSPQHSLTQFVGETDDLRRIRDAKRRDWETSPDLDRAVRLLTRWLRPGHGLCPDPAKCKGCEAQALKPAQAMALLELADGHAGLFCPMRVGSGKTLVSLLAPTLFPDLKPLLIVPADLKPKTRIEGAQYAKHWRIRKIDTISYEFLSNPKQREWLEEFAPGLIICDEADKLKNTGSKAWRRIQRYLAKHPNTIVLTLTGSPSSRSLSEYWHYLRASLKSQAPVPHDPLEMSAWCMAMDEKIPPESRYEPGALLTLADVPDGDQLDTVVHARLAFKARLISTPGVISTLEDIPDVPLAMWTREIEIPPHLVEAIQTMRETWATPDGQDFSLAMELWRHARTLGCGLFYKWDPAPPVEWKLARRAWHKFAREWLKYRTRTYDSTVHLEQLIREGEVDDGGILAAWREIEPTFKPNPVPVWVDDTMVRYCADWLKRERGIVWCEHKAFGRRLSQVSGVPFFSSKGLDQGGRLIDLVDGGPVIASIKACGRGHNLQAWHKNMFPSFPSKGSIAEQTIGRTHRDGQKHPVQCEIAVTCRESYTSLAQAVRDAMHTQQTLGQPQKLCYSKREFGIVEDLIASNDQWKEIGI